MHRCRYTLIVLMLAADLLPSVAASAPIAAPSAVTGQPSAKLIVSVNGFWSQQIASLGGQYRPPKLAYFTQPARGLCDVRASLSGPFYCPINETVYLDRPFLQHLVHTSAGAGRFALGYVVAHEVAHHVQNLLGTTGLVEQARRRSTPQLAGRTLTTLELQADCYTGLWARWASSRGTLNTAGDLPASLATIAAVSQAWQAHLTPGQEMLDPLSQGSDAQRLRWFRRGFDGGRFNDCDTFSAESAGQL